MHFLEGIRRGGWLCIVGSGHLQVMQWRASVRESAALVAGGSRRFCYQIDGVAEHLGVTLFKFMAGTLSNSPHCSGFFFFAVHWQSHLLPMNGGRRRRSPPPPPPEFYSRQRARTHDADSTTICFLFYCGRVHSISVREQN